MGGPPLGPLGQLSNSITLVDFTTAGIQWVVLVLSSRLVWRVPLEDLLGMPFFTIRSVPTTSLSFNSGEVD